MEFERLKSECQELQKKNAQRRAEIQMTNTQGPLEDEQDGNRVLQEQTDGIRELHDRQKHLEDHKIDLGTKVKHTAEKLAQLSKQVRMSVVLVVSTAAHPNDRSVR